MCYLTNLAIRRPLNSLIPSNKPKTCSTSNPRERKSHAFSFSLGCKEGRTLPLSQSLSWKTWATTNGPSSRWNHQNPSFFSGTTKICTQSTLFWSSARLWRSPLSSSTRRTRQSSLQAPSTGRSSCGISRMFSWVRTVRRKVKDQKKTKFVKLVPVSCQLCKTLRTYLRSLIKSKETCLRIRLLLSVWNGSPRLWKSKWKNRILPWFNPQEHRSINSLQFPQMVRFSSGKKSSSTIRKKLSQM